ncbi:uncharacterized protein LOC126611871 [Malus sylvestris]|uniref:uncharacterized protein LOC126611871 n=1 Tax=Malus sylvestris TaxID=3752 RepID=UPI0021ACA168|nr:uncharacterized protein LOC126611871 [Malus sylvestris]
MNTIKGLRDEAGPWHDSPNGIENVVMEYFRKKFQSQRVLPNVMSKVTDAVTLKVTPEMNAELLKPYSMEEIKIALFQMHPSNALGPDGMSSLFYQMFWYIVGDDVVEAVRSFLVLGLWEACFTHVVLFPKVSESQDMSPNLGRLAYVIWLISDNSLVAVEIGHFFHNKRCGKEGVLALKLDLSKAYDRVEWKFLKTMMVQLGFAREWIRVVMACAPSEKVCGAVLGFKASFLFGKAKLEECAVIQHILDVYSQALGQVVNLSKSSIAFNANVGELDQVALVGFHGVKVIKGWWIAQNFESLVAQLLKAQYFLTVSFWKAPVPRTSSYYCSSILKAREVLVCGSRWVVGNDESIKVWKERWLPRPPSFKVQSPIVPAREDLCDWDFIDL